MAYKRYKTILERFLFHRSNYCVAPGIPWKRYNSLLGALLFYIRRWYNVYRRNYVMRFLLCLYNVSSLDLDLCQSIVMNELDTNRFARKMVRWNVNCIGLDRKNCPPEDFWVRFRAVFIILKTIFPVVNIGNTYKKLISLDFESKLKFIVITRSVNSEVVSFSFVDCTMECKCMWISWTWKRLGNLFMRVFERKRELFVIYIYIYRN